MSTVHISKVNDLIAAVAELGAQLPAPIQDAADTLAAVRQWAPGAPPSIDSVVDSLTPTNAVAQLDEFVNTPVPREPTERAAVKARAIARTIDRFVTSVADHADDVIEAVRPMFTKACADMAKAAELVEPSATVQILDTAEDATITAWRALAEHRRTLDKVGRIVDLLDDFGGLGDPAHFTTADWKHRRIAYTRAAFYAPKAGLLDPVKRALRQPDGTNSPQGGRWHAISSAIVLNTASRARELLNEAGWQDLADHVANYNTRHSDPHAQTAVVEQWRKTQAAATA